MSAVNGLGTRVLTTGQVSRMFGVAPRTCAKWCDAGKLKGFRLPGSLDRRFYREDVVAFALQYGFKIPMALRQVLLCGLGERLAKEVAALLHDPLSTEITVVDSLFELGALLRAGVSQVVVVLDLGSLTRGACCEVARLIRGSHPTARLVALLPDDVPVSLLGGDFDSVLAGGVGAVEVAKVIQETAS